MKKILVPFIWVICSVVTAQAPQDWFHKSYTTSGFPGINDEGAYNLLKGRPSTTVIVAVIDGGVDPEHEDLKNVIWTNPREIPGNNIDDDNNGYVDDIHGWNFIGGKDGRNVEYDTYELTRQLKVLQAKAATDKKYQKQYEQFRKIYDEKYQESSGLLGTLKMIHNSFVAVKEYMERNGFESYNSEAVSKMKADQDMAGHIFWVDLLKSSMDGQEFNFNEVYDELDEGVKELSASVDYHLNPNYDPRNIVGDNYADQSERYYGNNDVKGPDASHGTHVAGIIAAQRGNGIGMDGVADNVRIMCLRVVPNGDERDKDIANAIRYAADNGAKVINMSFGKAYSPYKAVVDEAVKYAESKGVLLIHAAGNEAKNVDKEVAYPSRKLAGGSAAGWIEVGAMSWDVRNEGIATFSNYGKKTVDFFAPGTEIYSTMPDGEYKNQQGTSMAAPVVAGCAAVLMSYFPHLTPVQVRDILRKSVEKPTMKIGSPSSKKPVSLSQVSIAGGWINLENAVRMAMAM